MSCCGGNCGCGSGCKCGNSCSGGCKMYPENEMGEGVGVAPSKGSKAATGAGSENFASPSPSKENPSSATGADNGGCRCSTCTCNPCTCK